MSDLNRWTRWEGFPYITRGDTFIRGAGPDRVQMFYKSQHLQQHMDPLLAFLKNLFYPALSSHTDAGHFQPQEVIFLVKGKIRYRDIGHVPFIIHTSQLVSIS